MSQEEQELIDFNLNMKNLNNYWRLNYKHPNNQSNRREEIQEDNEFLPTNMHIIE